MGIDKKSIEEKLASLDRSIVATPETRENLDAFAKGNQGCMDFVLTQMAVQYGYKLALQEILTEKTSKNAESNE